jgi:hypothetical protein
MNAAERWRPACDYEDQVIASFLDGEPTGDVEAAAAHLASCPHCAEALRQDRALEALLAAQTRTDIDDAVADRLMAGIDRPTRILAEASPGGWWSRRAVAAAVFLLGLAVAGGILRGLGSGGGTGPEHERPDRAPDRSATVVRHDTTPVDVPPGPHGLQPGVAARGGFVVPDGARVVTRMAERQNPEAFVAFTDRNMLAAFRGEAVPGLDRRRLASEVRVLLIEAATRGIQRPGLIRAAVDWQLEEARRGLAGPDRLWLVGRVVLASEGETRRHLVETLRTHEARFHRFTNWRLQGRTADPDVVGLVGALGFQDLRHEVQELPMAQRVRCAMQARATGDRRCLAFLVDLFIHEAYKPEVSLDDYEDWFVGLSPAALDVVVWMMKRVSGRGQDALVKYRCEELMTRLGLTETSPFWFACHPRTRIRDALP